MFVTLIREVLTTHTTAQELIALYRAAESRAARMRLLLGAGRDLAVAESVEVAAAIVLQRATEFSAFPEACLMLEDVDRHQARVCARIGERYPQVGQLFAFGDSEWANALQHGFDSGGSGSPSVVLRFGTEGNASGALFLGAGAVAPTLDQEDRATLDQLLANFAAIVLITRQRDEQSRLNSLLAEREVRLDDLVGRLMSAQEDERRRLSIELHDGLAQITSSAYQHLQAFSERCSVGDAEGKALLESGMQLIRRATAETRSMMAGLRPSILDDFGIGKAITHEVNEFRRQHGEIVLDNALESVRLPADVETALFRVAQEAFRNIRKHAAGARVFVSFAVERDEVRLKIRDEGAGFSLACVDHMGVRGECLGLMGMQERMKRVGGVCRIESLPGCGVLIEAAVPCPEESPRSAHETRS